MVKDKLQMASDRVDVIKNRGFDLRYMDGDVREAILWLLPEARSFNIRGAVCVLMDGHGNDIAAMNTAGMDILIAEFKNWRVY